MTLDIAIAFRDTDGTYTRHVGAMLASLRHNTSRPFRVHVLHDDTLRPAEAEKLLSLLQSGTGSLSFHLLSPETCLPGLREDTPIMQPLTFATLYRLFLPSLPGLEHCPRLLYLDTDIIIDTDMGALWDLDLGQALLGAVPDPCLCGALTRAGDSHKDQWARRLARHNLSLGIPMTRYFNAGVLLLDLDGIRREKLFEQATTMILNQPNLLHPDQDALNKLFFNCSMFIPQKFNYLLHSQNVEDVEEGVWHYSGPCKPWQEPHMPKAQRYFHYLNMTPWASKASA